MNLCLFQAITSEVDQNTVETAFLESLEKKTRERVRLYRTRQPPEKGEPESYPLDHNHTHFLLLQDEFGDGDRKWKDHFNGRFRADLILPMRAQIEQESRKLTQQGRSKYCTRSTITIRQSIYTCIYISVLAFMIPIVQILVEGGVSSILTVCESIEAQTPVIVITVRHLMCDWRNILFILYIAFKGTGRAADLIAHEYKQLYVQEELRTLERYDRIAEHPITFKNL